jgi:hypothetical protein
MDNMDRMRNQTPETREGTKTTLGITGMILLTAAIIVILAVIAIWVL